MDWISTQATKIQIFDLNRQPQIHAPVGVSGAQRIALPAALRGVEVACWPGAWGLLPHPL